MSAPPAPPNRPKDARAAAVIALAGALLVFAPPTHGESISGVCPDGSIFIVQTAAAIPCSDARQVEPDRVPPIKPQYLPRPYAWHVFQSRQDPNNPYNLVGEAEAAGDPALAGPGPPPGAGDRARESPPPGPGVPPATAPGSPVAAAPQGHVAGAPSPALPEPSRSSAPPTDLGLAADEIRALVAIVELSQDRAPATLSEPDSRAPELLLRLARSPAFEARLHDAWAAAGAPIDGAVVVFAAEALAPVEFRANLTFAQGHVAYYPDASDRRQFGLLRGRQGGLAAGEIALGYVVLPNGTDPSAPIDIYWNDRRITAVLAPTS